MTIFLKDIWSIDNLNDYKIHFARFNGVTQPLKAWLDSEESWQAWQEFRPSRNDFNRTYVFSLMQFYHEADMWLFGGVFEILEDTKIAGDGGYKVRLTDQGKDFIGRLKIYYPHKDRATRTNMPYYYNKFEVQEILRERYSGESFPGFGNINLSFEELESLIHKQRPDWKSALENIKGIYLITDTETNKRYVGSAYGGDGIWSRWSNYIATGHGGNKAMRELVSEHSIDYCRANFRFTFLEHLLFNTPDKEIYDRESFWKEILLTRGEEGLNLN